MQKISFSNVAADLETLGRSLFISAGGPIFPGGPFASRPANEKQCGCDLPRFLGGRNFFHFNVLAGSGRSSMQ
jgi:hypothetical protein